MTDISGESCAVPQANCVSEQGITTLCLESREQKQNQVSGYSIHILTHKKLEKSIHRYMHCLGLDLLQITGYSSHEWWTITKQKSSLKGTLQVHFLLRNSAQEDCVFFVSLCRYDRSLQTQIEWWNHNFTFDAHDLCVFPSFTLTGPLEQYKSSQFCMLFEPLLTISPKTTFPFSM